MTTAGTPAHPVSSMIQALAAGAAAGPSTAREAT
jgi:hypothetical protein